MEQLNSFQMSDDQEMILTEDQWGILGGILIYINCYIHY